MIQHPFNELYLKDERLWRKYSYMETHLPYLDSPPITIISSGGASTAAYGKAVFNFKLSSKTDPIWVQLALLPQDGASVSIFDDRLTIICQDAALEHIYKAVKESIAATNQTYAEMRKVVVEKVGAQDAEKRKLAQAESERLLRLNERLRDLPL